MGACCSSFIYPYSSDKGSWRRETCGLVFSWYKPMHSPWVWGKATVSHLFWILPLPLQSTRRWGPWWFKHWLGTDQSSSTSLSKLNFAPWSGVQKDFLGKNVYLLSFLSSRGEWSCFFPTRTKLLWGRWCFLLYIPYNRKKGDQTIHFLSQESSIESRWGGMRYSLVINEWLLLFPFASAVHTIAESQNCWGWKGLLEIMQSAHLLNQGQIEQVAQG